MGDQLVGRAGRGGPPGGLGWWAGGSWEVLAMFDHSQSGQVTTSDLLAAAKAQAEMRDQNRHMKTLVKVLLGTLVCTLLGVFGVTIAARGGGPCGER